MYDVLKGIKVVELSMWAFVPSAGAVLADWGADVVKIVPLDVSDPMRGQGVVADLPEPRIDVPFMWELMNRGKRSIGRDIANRQGYEVFSALMRQADVFTINLLPPAQRRLHVTAEEVRAINPRIIVAAVRPRACGAPSASWVDLMPLRFGQDRGLGTLPARWQMSSSPLSALRSATY